jgi:TolC family type I secretion outer membrane protein
MNANLVAHPKSQGRLPSPKARWGVWIGVVLAAALVAPAAAQAQTLDDSVRIALRTSPAVESLREQLRAQKERRVGVEAQRRATVQGEATASVVARGARQQTFLGVGPLEWQGSEPASLGLTVEQPLYTGGRVRAALRTADLQIRQAEERLRAAEADVVEEMVAAWAGVRRDLAIVSSRAASVQVINELLEGARERFRLGEATLTDVAQTEARLASETSALATARADLSASQASFGRLAGDLAAGPTSATELPPLPATLLEAVDKGRLVNADLLSAWIDEAIAEARRKEIETEYNGRLTMQAGVTAGVDQGFAGNRSASGQLTARYTTPLWTGGLSGARLREAVHLREAARARAVDVARQVEARIVAAWSRLAATRASEQAARRQVAAASTALRGVQTEFLLGMRDQLAVLNQQAELSAAQINQINAEHDALIAHHAVLLSIGSLDAQTYDARPPESALRRSARPATWERPLLAAQERLDAVAPSVERARARVLRALMGPEE